MLARQGYTVVCLSAESYTSYWGFLCNIQLGGVHKLRLQEEGGRWSKKSTFCKLLYHRKYKWRGVGGQKKAKSCKHSL